MEGFERRPAAVPVIAAKVEGRHQWRPPRPRGSPIRGHFKSIDGTRQSPQEPFGAPARRPEQGVRGTLPLKPTPPSSPHSSTGSNVWSVQGGVLPQLRFRSAFCRSQVCIANSGSIGCSHHTGGEHRSQKRTEDFSRPCSSSAAADAARHPASSERSRHEPVEGGIVCVKRISPGQPKVFSNSGSRRSSAYRNPTLV